MVARDCTRNYLLFKLFHKIIKTMILETKRLIIRPISLDDQIDIFEYRRDREINKFQGWIPETIEDVKTFINDTAIQINMPFTWFQFVIVEKQTQCVIGDLGIHFLDKENKQVEIGCTVNKNFQKKGYATESVERVIDY